MTEEHNHKDQRDSENECTNSVGNDHQSTLCVVDESFEQLASSDDPAKQAVY